MIMRVMPQLRSAVTARFDSPEQEAFLNLWRTYDRLRALEDELFAGFDLTSQQYNVLRLLRAVHPGTLPTLALADRLVSRAPDITRMLDKLGERGLISRERPPENRRVVRIGITVRGRALLREIAEPLRACHSRQLGHMAASDLRKLTALLRTARAPHEPAVSPWR
jgi:DNA-binding MarR family transcriptional regulator